MTGIMRLLHKIRKRLAGSAELGSIERHEVLSRHALGLAECALSRHSRDGICRTGAGGA